jgi:hypothetical protein
VLHISRWRCSCASKQATWRDERQEYHADPQHDVHMPAHSHVHSCAFYATHHAQQSHVHVDAQLCCTTHSSSAAPSPQAHHHGRPLHQAVRGGPAAQDQDTGGGNSRVSMPSDTSHYTPLLSWWFLYLLLLQPVSCCAAWTCAGVCRPHCACARQLGTTASKQV